MVRATQARKRALHRYLPIAEWLPSYRREWIAGDIFGGLTAWALTIPAGMAFAGIAGVPVQYGLYAACLSLIAYAVFGTSRHLCVGPAAAVAAISAATVAPLAGGDPQRYIALTVALALMVGVLLIIGGLARLGSVAKFLARPVLDGYVVGTAIFIVVSQLDKLFGVAATGDNTFFLFADIFRMSGDWSWSTLAVGAACLLALVVLYKAVPRLPTALTVMVLSIVFAYLFGLGDHGVDLVGEIPSGLSGLSLSGVGMQDLVKLFPGALGLLVVAFAQSLALASAFAVRHRYRIDANQEMIALGAANLGSGLLMGFTVGGSFSRTAASEQAGGKTEAAFMFCSVLVLLTVFFFTGLFKYLPQATLAAIVIFAVGRLIDLRPLRRLRRVSTMDFSLALGALFGVLVFGVLEGVLIGVFLSLAGFVLRSSRPHSAVLGVDESGTRHGDLAERAECRPVSPYLIIYRFDAPFIFSNVDRFTSDILDLVEDADPRPLSLIVDCEMIYEMDTTASSEFAELYTSLAGEGVEVLLARVHAPVLSFMRRDDVVEMIGEDNIFLTVRDAVAAFRARHPHL
jgi:SulP family sulfate permease